MCSSYFRRALLDFLAVGGGPIGTPSDQTSVLLRAKIGSVLGSQLHAVMTALQVSSFVVQWAGTKTPAFFFPAGSGPQTLQQHERTNRSPFMTWARTHGLVPHANAGRSQGGHGAQWPAVTIDVAVTISHPDGLDHAVIGYHERQRSHSSRVSVYPQFPFAARSTDPDFIFGGAAVLDEWKEYNTGWRGFTSVTNSKFRLPTNRRQALELERSLRDSVATVRANPGRYNFGYRCEVRMQGTVLAIMDEIQDEAIFHPDVWFHSTPHMPTRRSERAGVHTYEEWPVRTHVSGEGRHAPDRCPELARLGCCSCF